MNKASVRKKKKKGGNKLTFLLILFFLICITVLVSSPLIPTRFFSHAAGNRWSLCGSASLEELSFLHYLIGSLEIQAFSGCIV